MKFTLPPIERMMIERGSIRSVPSLGADALCLVLTPARGISRGRPEHLIAPLYEANVGRATTSDAVIRADETSLGRLVFAGLWNVRAVLAADLGEETGVVTRDAVLTDLRDGYLRLADSSIRVARGRMGDVDVDDAMRAWRSAEVRRWQPLTGRVLGPELPDPEHIPRGIAVSVSLRRTCPFDYQTLSREIRKTEADLGDLELLASGRCMVVIGLPAIPRVRMERETSRVWGNPPTDADVVRSTSFQFYAPRLGDFRGVPVEVSHPAASSQNTAGRLVS